MRVYVLRRPVRFSEEAISIVVGQYLAHQLPEAYLDEIAAPNGMRPVIRVNGRRVGIWGRRVGERRKAIQQAERWLGGGGVDAVCVVWYPDVLYTCADEEVLWRRLRSERFDGVLLRSTGIGIVGTALFRTQLAGIAQTLAVVVGTHQ